MGVLAGNGQHSIALGVRLASPEELKRQIAQACKTPTREL